MKQLVDSDETISRWRPRVTAQVIKQMYTLVVSLLLLLGRMWSGPAKSIPTTSKLDSWSFLRPEEERSAAVYMVLKGDDKEHILLLGFLLPFFLVGSKQLFVSPSEFGSLQLAVSGDGHPR